NMCALFIVYEMDLWTKSLSESVNGTNAEGRAYRRIKVQMCPQMLVPRKIKLQNRALFYWTKINP
ncbi:hypothetical protein HID58_074984, partial [Brassica napus]